MQLLNFLGWEFEGQQKYKIQKTKYRKLESGRALYAHIRKGTVEPPECIYLYIEQIDVMWHPYGLATYLHCSVRTVYSLEWSSFFTWLTLGILFSRQALLHPHTWWISNLSHSPHILYRFKKKPLWELLWLCFKDTFIVIIPSDRIEIIWKFVFLIYAIEKRMSIVIHAYTFSNSGNWGRSWSPA